MPATDPRVDAYIDRAAPFARPILTELRARVHAACPDAQETIKWGKPFFVYKDAPLCLMAASKQHAAFGFWRGREVVDDAADEGMGQFGKLASVDDLPSKRSFAAAMKKALARIDSGAKAAPAREAPRPPPAVPDDLAAPLALPTHAAARATWKGFTPGKQRDYVDWLTEAKTDATRAKRLATTLEWLALGRTRHWKYRK